MIMRKYTVLLTLLPVLAMAVFTSCNKESTSGGVLPPDDTSTDKLILSNLFGGTKVMTPVQEYEVPAGAFRIIHGNAKTRLTFYPNSFKDEHGNTISSGQIKIRMVEMYRPGQVIANRSTTTADGRLLRSGGQVYIRAYRGGKEVFPRVYGIGFPTSNTNQPFPMQLFYGGNAKADSTVAWTKSADLPGTRVTIPFLDTFTVPNNLLFQFDSCTRFGWVNCDDFYDIAGRELTNIYMVSKDSVGLSAKNTQVFLVFPTINSVSYMQHFDPATHTWSLAPSFQVPINLPFHAVSLSYLNGQYYYSEVKNLVVTNNILDTLRPEVKPLMNVHTLLNNL